jgi:hypothetical protein
VCGFIWTTKNAAGNKSVHTCGVRINPNTLDHTGRHICNRKHRKNCIDTHSK